MQIFENNNYKWISNLIEEKMPLLRENKDFDRKYKDLTNTIESFESKLSQDQKEEFNKIVNLFYETEEYYFTLSYFLGAKFGEDLKKF